LITLYLVSKGLLKKPTLYLSAHIEKHKSAYYDALSRVRESNDIGQWVRSLLTAVRDTGQEGTRTFQEPFRVCSSGTGSGPPSGESMKIKTWMMSPSSNQSHT
jgi:hypothetical protein